MGEVVKGMFGKSYGTSGLGQVEGESTPASVEPARDTPSAAVSPSEVARNLEMLLSDVRTAANRLINMPPPGVVPEALKTRLLATYTQLESRARALADKVGTTFDAVIIDQVQALQGDAVAYVSEVESTLRQVGVPGLEPKSSKRKTWMLYGVLAVGLGVAGFAGYQAYKHNKAPASSKRPIKRSKTAASRKKFANDIS